MKSIKLQITKQNIAPMIIEAGHIYTHQTPEEEHQIGAQVGSSLVQYFQALGVPIEKWLFIDDYNPNFASQPEVLDQPAYLDLLQQWDFSPDKVVYESSLVEQAQENLEVLIQGGFTKDKKGKIVLAKGNIPLFDPKQEKYMCALLDACLYQQKLDTGSGCITVLDQQYQSQQKGTLLILKKLGVQTQEIYPYFFSTEKVKPDGSSFIQNSLAMFQLLTKLPINLTYGI